MTGGTNRAVFLDRDGVLSRSDVWDGKPFAPVALDGFDLLPDAAPAAAALKRQGFLLVVVTNQPDVGNGKVARETVDAMNRRLAQQVPVDAIKVCYHPQSAGCACRKPAPGMLIEAARELDIDLAASFMVGDRWSDVAAGKAAGCRTVFIDRHYAERRPEAPDFITDSLAGAAELIVQASPGPHPLPDMTKKGSRMPDVKDLTIKLFADGADFDGMFALYGNPLIKGFTTNPTLMRKAGVQDYEAFARKVLTAIPDRPVSFEVFADDLPTMAAQARVIASWGANVNVKIPVTNTKGEFTGPIIGKLSAEGVQLNVTAVFTLDQVRAITKALAPETAAIVSVFAGRVADTGVDPMPLMAEALKIMAPRPKAELLWASPRELLNIFQADQVGCHIITATNDVLGKLKNVGKDLAAFSLETVEMFYGDARAAGYTIAAPSDAAAE